MEFLGPVIQMLVDKYPIAAQVIFVIGVARIIVKPLFVALEQIVKDTPASWDNELFQKVIDHKAYKAVSFALDLAFSIKLPKKQ